MRVELQPVKNCTAFSPVGATTGTSLPVMRSTDRKGRDLYGLPDGSTVAHGPVAKTAFARR